MEFNVKNVSTRLTDYNEIKSLFVTAFPENERLPMWLLRFLSRGKNVRFEAFYDAERFCGLAYTIHSEKMIFLVYLAVDDRLRSKGYGTRILHWLKKRANGKAVVLNVEAPDKSADNYEQRVKRLAFYGRNNVHKTSYLLKVRKDTYHILSTHPQFPLDELKSFVKKYHMGTIEEAQPPSAD